MSACARVHAGARLVSCLQMSKRTVPRLPSTSAKEPAKESTARLASFGRGQAPSLGFHLPHHKPRRRRHSQRRRRARAARGTLRPKPRRQGHPSNANRKPWLRRRGWCESTCCGRRRSCPRLWRPRMLAAGLSGSGAWRRLRRSPSLGGGEEGDRRCAARVLRSGERWSASVLRALSPMWTTPVRT